MEQKDPIRQELEAARIRINELETRLEAIESRNFETQAKHLMKHGARQLKSRVRRALSSTAPSWSYHENPTIENDEWRSFSLEDKLRLATEADSQNYNRPQQSQTSVIRKGLYTVVRGAYRGTRYGVKRGYAFSKKVRGKQ